MKKSLFVTLWLLGFIPNIQAALHNFERGSKAMALGGASSVLYDVFAVENNQSILSLIEYPTVGVYTEARYAGLGILQTNISAAMPTNSGNFGLGINYYGFDLYNEVNIGIAYGRQFGEKFGAGLRFDYYRIGIQEFGNRNTVSFQLGFHYQLLKKVRIAAHLSNPVRIKLDEAYEENIPTLLKFGLAYEPSEKVLITSELEKDINLPAAFKAGIEYKALEQMYVRIGMRSNPVLVSMGVGVKIRNISIDVSAAYHTTLGISPQFGLVYTFNKEEQNSTNLQEDRSWDDF